MRKKTFIATPAFRRLGYFQAVPAGTRRNAAAASTFAVNGPLETGYEKGFSYQPVNSERGSDLETRQTPGAGALRFAPG